MSRLLCCLCVRRVDMGAALSHPQDGEACDAGGLVAPPTMADVIRERKKKAGGAALGTLRRRLAAAARRPRDARPDRGCEHARFIRSVVASWRLAEVFLLAEELEAGAALRDLATQAELAREPARALPAALGCALRERWGCDVQLTGAGWALPAHRAVLAARCDYFRELLQRHPGAGVPLEGAAASLSRAEVEACVCALYSGSSLCARRPLCAAARWDGELDILNVEGAAGRTACGCGAAAGSVRRLGALLGFAPDALHRDMRYLLDSGEHADARLVFRLEGGSGAQYGFRSALELPCHRVVLAARSRFFRSVMSRRAGACAGGAAGAGGAVCVDEKVLPRRFARALLHAAYTDQVDLSLVGRASGSPAGSGGGGATPSTAWAGVARGAGGTARSAGGAALLDDAFQLYEIARFLEMPIVVQGCEDAIAEALSAETLPHVLRWAAAPHASQWVHRQAMRYLRDEFPAIMAHAASARLPHAALQAALASPFLQASEAQALRALLRWGERAALSKQPGGDQREPNVVWHTAHSVSRRGARRREVSDAALREVLAALVPLVRAEHLPPEHELLAAAARRGLLAPPAAGEEARAADAWLGRGAARPARCFLPYLDELKALLREQAPPDAELARLRRARSLHRIPDTLYMVAAAPAPAPAPSAESACVSPRVLAALRARARELRGGAAAARALAAHHADALAVHRQICLRAVREMSLPDACADLLLADVAADADAASDRERGGGGWDSPRAERRAAEMWGADDCCRVGGAGGSRCASVGSLRSQPSLHIPLEKPRGTASRRELPPRPADSHAHRQSLSELSLGGGGAGAVAGGGAARVLSAAVPDVAMAPNANTHLLTARDYFRHAPPHPAEYGATGSVAGVGGVLQLDLGDGATHTPRPGSRAGRAAAVHAERARAPPRRDPAQALPSAPRREDELRAALELSVVRAYSSFHAGAPGSPGGARCRPPSATLPPCYRAEPPPLRAVPATASRRGGPPSPASLSASNSGHLAARHDLLPHPAHSAPHAHRQVRRVSSAERGGGGGGGAAESASPSPSPSPSPRDYVYRHRDYRLEPSYGSSGSGSRGHSPSNYA